MSATQIGVNLMHNNAITQKIVFYFLIEQSSGRGQKLMEMNEKKQKNYIKCAPTRAHIKLELEKEFEGYLTEPKRKWVELWILNVKLENACSSVLKTEIWSCSS